MTDKQIIIDGVNVKDCKRRIGKDNFCRYYKRPCAENNYNCIWKKYLRKEQELQEAMDNYVQLDLQRVKEYNELVDLYKAKEQECEELKKNVEHWKIEHKEAKAKGEWTYDLVKKRLGQQLDQLKESNEELQKENDKYALLIEKRCDYIGLECDSEEQAMRTLLDLTSQTNKAIWIIDRYKQTLAEIKKIAEGMHDLWINKTPYTDKNNLAEHLLECELNRIRYKLDEISECEEENEYS